MAKAVSRPERLKHRLAPQSATTSATGLQDRRIQPCRPSKALAAGRERAGDADGSRSRRRTGASVAQLSRRLARTFGAQPSQNSRKPLAQAAREGTATGIRTRVPPLVEVRPASSTRVEQAAPRPGREPIPHEPPRIAARWSPRAGEPPPPGSAVEATRTALNPLLERGRYGGSAGALAA